MIKPTLFLKSAIAVITVLTLSLSAHSKKENNDQTITAKVWFKDGSVYEGPLLKHWRTYRQTFMMPAHDFHIAGPDGKSMKHGAKDTDSIMITGSTHPDFKAGDFYVSFNGQTNTLGGRKIHKFLKREYAGKNADMCKLTYMGNCTVSGKNMDQLMEYWLVRFRDSGRVSIFFDNPLQNGCNRPRGSCINNVISKINPELTKAIESHFFPDKETGQESILAIQKDPMVYINFIDSYLTNNPTSSN
ncbi:MAG: hypothetical protein K2M93_08125 [Muribaculaceae bacterium]|nr:hypothetical protein [Muribaculaceae bacterium]